MSLDLFSKPIENLNISVFHDESGSFSHGKWSLTGLFWIKDDFIDEINQDLKNIRKEEEYEGEIHFCKLAKFFQGQFGAKARVAKKWFSFWENKWIRKSWFNVFAINRICPEYDHSRFDKKFHAYNRFTAMALKGGLAWYFNNENAINLKIYSDEKARRPEGLLGDGFTTDNFEIYLESKLNTFSKYKGPKVCLKNQIECLSCAKKGPFSPQEEILQLTDLLLGSVQIAINPKSNRETKCWFGKQMAKIMEDTKLKPWKQKYRLHRRFSVNYFPNKNGRIYKNEKIEINKNKNQLTLDFNTT